MTFLDSSVVIHYLDNADHVVRYVDDETTPPYFTSALCIYEVLMGAVHTPGNTDLRGERSQFDWVNSLELNEGIAVEGARIQDELKETGDLLSPRDVLIAATARSTGDELVVADGDFDTDRLRKILSVTALDDPTEA
jgi:predicted nucleic acid-binding protein